MMAWYAMTLVLAGWGVYGFALRGIGFALVSCWTPREERDEHPLFWIGFAATIGFLQLWNFFFPVDARTAGIVLLVGVPFGIASLVRVGRSRFESRRWLVPFALVALFLSNRAIGTANSTDSGLYHLPAIQWALRFPIIPGIANLQPAFAMNNASFLYTAMLDAAPFNGRGHHLANGLLLLVFAAEQMKSAVRVARGLASSVDWFHVALLPILVFLMMGKDVPSPKTDMPVGLLTLVVIRCALQFGEAKLGRRSLLQSMAVLAAAAPCLKLSAGVGVPLVTLAMIAVWWISTRPAARELGITLATGLAASALLIAPWIARNVVLSGYPLYPSSAFPAPVSWRAEPSRPRFVQDAVLKTAKFEIPKGLAREIGATSLRAYARLMNPPVDTYEELTATNWQRAWFFTMLLTTPLELPVPLMFAAALWLVFGRQRTEARDATRVGVFAALAVAFVFWFVTAPDPRYVWPTCWAIAGVTAAVVLSGAISRRQRHVAIAAVAAVCLIAFTYRVAQARVYAHASFARIFWNTAGPDHGFAPPASNPMVPWQSRWGLTVLRPANNSGNTWAATQPAANWPPPDPDLRLRREGDLSAGFVVDRSSRE